MPFEQIFPTCAVSHGPCGSPPAAVPLAAKATGMIDFATQFGARGQHATMCCNPSAPGMKA